MVKCPLVLISGPTCSGKSDLAIELCEKFPVEIISADSGMIYCDMNIGTDKPSITVRKKYKHHLIDVCSPLDFYSVNQFSHDVINCSNQIRLNHHIPVIVGGTMMYVQALLQQWFAETKANFDLIPIVYAPFDKPTLDYRVELRFERMLKNRVVSEAENLLNKYNLDDTFPSYKVVGYRQIFSYLKNEIDHSTMKKLAFAASRQLAKKQFTWLRNYNFGERLTADQIFYVLNGLVSKWQPI